MPKTKVEVSFTRAASTVDPSAVVITTPAGRTVMAEEAARAVDGQDASQRELSRALNERDQARRERDQARREWVCALVERDQARAELGALSTNPNFAFIGGGGRGPTELPVTGGGGGQGQAPAPTRDTPVTLGMLEDIITRAKRLERGGQYDAGADALLQAVAEKIGGVR